MKFLKNLGFGVCWWCSGGENLQQIHRGIDPEDIFDFKNIDFFKI